MTTEIIVFDEVAKTIAEWKVENEKLVFEYDTPKGEKAARSHIHLLRKVKVKVGEIHRDAKAEALAFGRKLDAKKNEYNGQVDEMIKVHKDPLDAIEAEKERVKAVARAKDAAEERQRLADIEAREVAIKIAEEKLAKEKAEAERVERERQIAADAAENARQKAEERAAVEAVRVKAEAKAKAETEAKALVDAAEAKVAKEKAIGEAKLAEGRANALAVIEAREKVVREAEEKIVREKAEAERIIREKQIAAEAAEKAKVEAEAKAKAEAEAKELTEKKAKEEAEAKEQRRIANKRHIQKIEGNIHETLMEIGLSKVDASNVLLAIKDNKIPCVSINY